MATKIGFSDGWPKWAKPVFALAGAALWIGVPMVAAWNLADRTVQAGGVVDYQPILVVLVGITTATITGTFMFMTFRIDRGTRRKAKSVAKSAANKALKNIKRKAKRKVDKTTRKKLAKGLTPERIRREVNARLTEESVRKHIEAVLMMKANGQIVAEYAKEHAEVLDSEAFKQLIHLLDEVIRRGLPDDPAKRIDENVGWFGRLKAHLTR